ncbi:TonB-dependent receptor [Chitinophagaceae bacterium LB-8]|uniref:TonB-dependent receptor n=1 Tax=Paraflavisolibacter caeni TaxID=2982496 RepID=A0A9X2XXV6_9BACT|nr:TonB-dependent receptor [Paraflavisolibacter caeni]MCU7549708.1 TonB-dependent receptor [Paraflavisolibacter caeni]
MKFKIALLQSFIAILFFVHSHAQDVTVTGKVTNKTNGENLPGATVRLKGNETSTQTDVSGSFKITVPLTGSILIVTYIGMQDQEVPVKHGQTAYDIQLDSKAGSLNEVVVVGYGTQKRATLTGAISSVKAKDLENVPNGRIEQALQGRVSGVTILQNSGQPGSSSTIRVRGITTFNNNNPLWVVDGVVIDAGGIGYLNQSDIESIEVLKDAASAAIYGTRAATGVILVTTKKGRSGKPIVNYNGFYGVSGPAKMLDLLNATQYAVLRNESEVAAGKTIVFPNVTSVGKGTDWQKEIFNNSANRYLHEISLSGGNDKSTFYLSAGIQDQEGIVATEISNYNKTNIRLNSTHKISNIFSFGQTLGYTHQKTKGIGNTNSEYGGPLSSAINLDPITPLVVTEVASQPNASIYSNTGIIKDANGNPYGISNWVGQEMTNPIAYMQTRLGQYSWSDDIVGNAYLEVAPIKGLKIRSTIGAKKAYWGNIGYTPLFYLSSTVSSNKNSYNKGENKSFNWNIENTVNYNRKFGDHDFTLLLGQGAYVENIGGNVGMTFYNLPISDYRDASFRFDVGLANRDGYAGDLIEHKITSLFSRLNYTYLDKYFFTGIVRRDGSTRFGANNKYGVFPSFSAGYNINRENFWPVNKIVNSLKLRGGYGIVGNDALDDFRYLSTVVGGYNYSLGNTGTVTTGYAPETLDNPDLHWEETASADIGIESQLFTAFNLTVNWFNKKTTGILRPVVIPGYVGVSSNPWANVADMKNTGIEVELGYHKSFGDFNFSVNANGSYLKNTVTYVAADTNFISGGAGFQSMGTITRIQVDHPYNSFWGYKKLGIFQNEQDIQNYKNKNGALIQPNARPGDFIWADLDGDGKITSGDLDKSFLGSSIPKYSFGFTINMDYKGFDFMAFAQGVAGSKIFQGLRRLDILAANYPAKAMSRWTSEGSSNDYPRLISSDPNGNFSNMSEFYLEKGDYLRLKLVQLGYTLPNKFFQKIGVSRFRIYVTGENLVTLTNYTGYDPEVGGGIFGIDRGQYPQARTILGGVQLTF